MILFLRQRSFPAAIGCQKEEYEKNKTAQGAFHWIRKKFRDSITSRSLVDRQGPLPRNCARTAACSGMMLVVLDKWADTFDYGYRVIYGSSWAFTSVQFSHESLYTFISRILPMLFEYCLRDTGAPAAPSRSCHNQTGPLYYGVYDEYTQFGTVAERNIPELCFI
jgi:hypothetical protein